MVEVAGKDGLIAGKAMVEVSTVLCVVMWTRSTSPAGGVPALAGEKTISGPTFTTEIRGGHREYEVDGVGLIENLIRDQPARQSAVTIPKEDYAGKTASVPRGEQMHCPAPQQRDPGDRLHRNLQQLRRHSRRRRIRAARGWAPLTPFRKRSYRRHYPERDSMLAKAA